MSSATATIDDDAAAAPKPRKKRKLLLLAIPVLLLVLGAGVWFSGLLGHRHGHAGGGHAEVAEKPSQVDVPDIVTNLDNGARRAVFIKLKARIEVSHVADQAAITANMPRILDLFQTYLRSLTPEDIHGGDGMYRLREALMSRIDTIVAPVQVHDLLFVELIVQ